jgi:GH15 family glucan-1,4-alpha-glucosidase
MAAYKNLEDYGIIGDLDTCALVAKDGSIDWLCFPHLDSPSVFGCLLDAETGGHFSIRPATKYDSLQSYAGYTNILQTTFSTPLGYAVLTDFMSVKEVEDTGPPRTLFRKVECPKGMVKLSISIRPRFNYASAIPDAEPAESGLIFRRQDEYLYLQSTAPMFVHDGGADGSVTLQEGESLWFLLRYNHNEPLEPKQCDRTLARVRKFWQDWAHTCDRETCVIDDPWHHLAVRSGLVLKLLSNPDNGAIAAAATTSLPEMIGGVRNWDYRYSWIRDAAFTNQALFHLGHVSEARAFRNWLIGIAEAAGDPSRIMTMYPLRGERDLEERVLDHLSGYEGSKPVRIGNAAAKQKQLDIFGEMLNAVYDTTRHGEEISPQRWTIFRGIIDYVRKVWSTKDSGIWEVRGAPRHFVYSKLMCWVALDRGIRIAQENSLEAPLKDWEMTREQIETAILEKGFSKKLDSFVQSFGSEDIDSTGLLIAPMGFLPHNDPRVLGTIDAVLKRLVDGNGLIRRYEGDDGLPAGEGCFVLCSFWLIKALVLAERVEEAEKIFSAVLGYVSPLGLLSEEIDPHSGRLIGNFPQAFSHVGVINSALYLGIAGGRKYAGPRPLGMTEGQKKGNRDGG